MKLKFEVGVQYRCTYFCSEENLTHLVQSMHLVVTQCHKINFKSATSATKLCTRRDKTWLDSAKNRVCKPGI